MYKKIIIGVILMTSGIVGYNVLSNHKTPPVFVAGTAATTSEVSVTAVPSHNSGTPTVIVATKATSSSVHVPTLVATQPSNLTLVVGTTTYPLVIAGKETVLAAMQTLSSTTNFAFTGKENPSMGLFVESINNKKNENGNYWFLYVNGISASYGVSTQEVSPGDTIEWKYDGGY